MHGIHATIQVRNMNTKSTCILKQHRSLIVQDQNNKLGEGVGGEGGK